MAITERTIFPGYKWWRYPKGKFTRGCSIYFVAVGSWTQQPASSPTFPDVPRHSEEHLNQTTSDIPRHSEQHHHQRINGGQTTPNSRRHWNFPSIKQPDPQQETKGFQRAATVCDCLLLCYFFFNNMEVYNYLRVHVKFFLQNTRTCFPRSGGILSPCDFYCFILSF